MSESPKKSTVAGDNYSKRRKPEDPLASNFADLVLIVGALLGFGILYAVVLPYLPPWARTVAFILGVVAVGGFIRSRARPAKK